VKRRKVNFWLDLAAFAAFLVLAGSGAVLRWGLPPGRGRRLGVEPLLLGWGRHDWRDLHLWVAIAFVALVAVHLVLHWSWIRANLFPRRAPVATPGPGSPASRPGDQTAGLDEMLTRGVRDFTEEDAVDCARCEHFICREGTDCTGTGEDAVAWYEPEADHRLHAAAARVEAEGYGRLCRIEELTRFCAAAGIRRIGLAFCAGLTDEARLLEEALRGRLEVASVCCKVCAIPKEKLDLPKIHADRFEAACNPIAQARILAQAGTELNCIVGLCLGHDLLFTKHSAAPVTTLVVKDRVLGHNPVAALHSSYFRERVFAGGAGRDSPPGRGPDPTGA
jgi:uncharacterized metal-binding protein